MDCNGECFGMFYEDECGVCDDNINNDNITCSGCTDIIRELLHEDGPFDDGAVFIHLIFALFKITFYYSKRNKLR